MIFDESDELTERVWFFRKDFCYEVWGRANEDWIEHVSNNPGTVKVVDSEGKQIWPTTAKMN